MFRFKNLFTLDIITALIIYSPPSLWQTRDQLHGTNKLSYGKFCLKFRCHGNKGRSEVNLNDPVELAVPENHTLEPNITNLSCIQPKL